MSPRYKKGKRKLNYKFKSLIYNISLIVLVFIIFGFLSSGIKRFFFNSAIDPAYPDLSTLFTQTEYEKKQGIKFK